MNQFMLIYSQSIVYDVVSNLILCFTTTLGKYLGFKIFQGRPKRDDFPEAFDLVASRLMAWKRRLLNKPGRVTLANSVLSSIPDKLWVKLFRLPT